MGARSKMMLVAGGALMAVVLKQRTFVPPVQKAAPAVAAATMMGGVPVFADAIGDATKELSKDAYPFLKEIDWTSGLSLTNPGSGSPTDWAKAVGTAIDMGAAMDPKLLKAGVEAHHKAIGSAGSGLVTSSADFEAVNAAVGRMVASVPESKTMDVYNAFSNLVSPDVPTYLMSTVKEADAKEAYEAFLKFKSQPVVFDGEPSGCNESIQRVLELQGCREGFSMIVVVSTMRRAVQTLQLRTFRTCGPTFRTCGPGLANLGVWLQVCTWSTRRAFSLCIVCAVFSSGRSGRIVQNLQRVHCNTY